MDGKRLGSILILAVFMGVMLVSQGRAQGWEDVYRMDGKACRQRFLRIRGREISIWSVIGFT